MASIKKRPDGAWRARYRDPSGREHARHFSRKIDAQLWLDEVTTSIVTGQYVSPAAGKITFAKFYADWSSRQVWADTTRSLMDITAKSVSFGSTPLKAILPSHIETWVKEMTASGMAVSTIHTRFANLHGVFRGAVRDRLIAVDPADGIKLPRQRRGEHAMRLPLPDEVRSLIAHATEEHALAISFAAFAGLRPGEICGLQVQDINFLGRALHVARQVQRGHGAAPDIRPPKFGSERTVYLPARLIDNISAHVARHGLAADDWMFSRPGGRPWDQNVLNAWWPSLRIEASAPDVRLHDLRHFYASGLISAGCDVVTVQRALGHTSAVVTLNTYAHLWPSAEDRTREAAGVLLMAVVGADADTVRTEGES